MTDRTFAGAAGHDGTAHRTPGATPGTLADATVDIAASPDEVFEALLDPAALAAWFGVPGGGPTRDWQVDPTAGGRWRARGTAADGTPVELHGSIAHMEPPHVLEWRWFVGPGGALPSTVRYDLEPHWHEGELATRLRVRHVAAPPSLAPVTMGGSGGTAGYWSRQLRALAMVLAVRAARLARAAR